MKKLTSIMAVAALSLGILAGCGNTATPPTTTAGGSTSQPAAEKKLKVAVVYSGFLGDKSFNDSAHEGLLKAQKELGIEFKELESKEPTEWESNFVAMAEGDYDIVMAVSTQFEEILKKHAPNYPNKKFALIDGVVEGSNIVSTTFAQNEGSFLAGAAAALFTTKTDIPGVNPDKIIGWVGGMDIPVLADFFTGYEQGAKAVVPDIKVLQSFAGSFNDPLKGKELTVAQYSQGADIVMNVASGTGNGILEAAKEQGKYAIGVDLNQDDVYPGSILTSMLKRVDNAVYLVAKSVQDGTYQGGKTTYLDINNGGVGLTDMSTMKKALGDKFPEDILTKIQELEAKVKSKEITVNFAPGYGPK